MVNFTTFTTTATHGRSTAVLVRNDAMDAVQQQELTTPSGITCTCVELLMAETCLNFSNVYISPTTKLADFRAFMEEMALRRPYILIGDMNARDSKWCPACADDEKAGRALGGDAVQRGKVLQSFVTQHRWSLVQPTTRTATHFPTNARGTTPDVALISTCLVARNTTVTPTPASDHAQLSFELLQITATRRPAGPSKISWRRVTQHHERQFQQRLDSLLRRYDPAETLERRLYAFVAAVRTAARCLPQGKYAQHVPAWSTNLSKLRKQALEQAAAGSPEAAESRAVYNATLLTEYDDWISAQPSQFWATSKERAAPAAIVLSDGARATTAETRCAAFATHFASKHFSSIETEPYVYKEAPPPAPVTRTELMAAIHAHPKRKSNDPDGLKAEHLAMLSQRAMDILCEIMTDSLRTGAVPSSWRTARARPTYKTGKPATHINSYRPVAITSIICRTLERITLRRLEESLQVHTHNRQFGFRRAHSCEQLLRTLQLDLAPTATKQEVSLITAFDMSDAFCKVHRDIVANRLVDALHVQHSFARWVHAFMTGRTFSVYEGMYTGPPVAQHHGVPQGSVLGPFLWNVFVNPLFQALDQQAKSVSAPMILRSKIRVYGYADDMTTMISMARTPFCTPKSITQVGNAVVSTFNSWCQVHGVTLSPKSHSILVGEGLHWAAKTLTLESGGVRVL
eukprot:PhM_4_TR2448/c3_g1_i3/m.79181